MDMTSGLTLHNRYIVECWSLDGTLRWRGEIENLIPTQGLNKALNSIFASSSSATWYVGLVDGVSSPTYAAADTLASHGGWAENVSYSGNRSTLVLGTVSAGSVDNSASKASFSMTTGGTIAGAFVTDKNGGTTGNIYGEGSLAGGNRAFANGDTLNITCTLTAS